MLTIPILIVCAAVVAIVYVNRDQFIVLSGSLAAWAVAKIKSWISK